MDGAPVGGRGEGQAYGLAVRGISLTRLDSYVDDAMYPGRVRTSVAVRTMEQ